MDRWPALMRKADAAEYLGLSLTQFNRLLMAGAIVPRRISERRIGIRRADLDDYIASLPLHRTAKQKAEMRPKLNGG